MIQDLTLDQLGSVSRGRSRHRPRDAAFLYGGPYPFVQTGNIKKAGLYLRNYDQTYSEAGLAQSKLWPVGTLCITIAANIAETSILDIEACFPDSVIGFIVKPEIADARFIKYLFDATLKLRFQSFTQGAAQDNLSQAKLLSIKFPVPDLVVQVKIADILTTYDNLIENNRRQIALLEAAARLLYREWFVHFQFPGHENININRGLPVGWNRTTIGARFDTVLGGTPSRKNEDFWDGDIAWINSSEVNKVRILAPSECITEEGLAKSAAKLMPSGTTVVAITGATLGQVSRLEIEASANQSVVGIYDSDSIQNELIYLFFCYEIDKIVIQATGGAQQHINKEIVKAVEYLEPPLWLISTFSELVKPIFDQMKNLELQNINLQKARDLLLPRLMSGEIGV